MAQMGPARSSKISLSIQLNHIAFRVCRLSPTSQKFSRESSYKPKSFHLTNEAPYVPVDTHPNKTSFSSSNPISAGGSTVWPWCEYEKYETNKKHNSVYAVISWRCTFYPPPRPTCVVRISVILNSNLEKLNLDDRRRRTNDPPPFLPTQQFHPLYNQWTSQCVSIGS